MRFSNNYSNSYAISASGIGEAMQRSAAALASAGNSMEESIGLVTAMNEIVQNPQVVGTALKTMTMYLRAAKTAAEEAGIETDGMASSVSTLRSKLIELTGVDIMKTEDEFKSTYEIIKELSEAWVNLTDVSKANVLNLLGGKRQANSIAALISNFEAAEAAMKTAAESTGSAMAENEKFLDSVTGKLQVLHAQFQELSYNVLNSNLLKVVLDIGSALLSMANYLSQIGSLVPMVISMGTAFSAIKKTLVQLADSTSGVTNFIAGFKANFGVGGVITLGISAAVSAVSAIIAEVKRLKQEAIDAAHAAVNTFESAESQTQSNIDRLKALEDEYNELASKTNRTTSEQTRYKAIMEEIESLTPKVATATDGAKDSVDQYASSVKTATAANEAFLSSERQKIINNWQSVWDGLKVEAGDAIKEVQGTLMAMFGEVPLTSMLSELGVESIVNPLEAPVDLAYNHTLEVSEAILANQDIFLEQFGDNIARGRQYIAYLEDYVEKYYATFTPALTVFKAAFMEDGDWFSNIPTEALGTLNSLLSDTIDTTLTADQQLEQAKATAKTFADTLGDFRIDKLRELAKGVQDGTEDISDFEEEYAALEEAFADNSVALAILSWIKSTAEFKGVVSDLGDAADDGVDSLQNLGAAATSAQKRFDLLNKAIEEQKDGGGLSFDTYQSIVDALAEGENIADYITVENGLLKLNEDAWRQRAIAILEAQKVAAQAIIDNATTEDEDGTILIDENATENAKIQIQAIELLIEELTADTEEATEAAIAYGDAVDGFDKMRTAAKGVYEAIDALGEENAQLLNAAEMLELFDGHLDVLANFDVSTIDGQREALQTLADTIEFDYTSAIDTAIESLEQQQGELDEVSEEYQELDNQIEALQLLKDFSIAQILNLGQAAEEADEAAESIKSVADQYKDLQNLIDNGYDISATGDYQLTADTLTNLLAIDARYAQAIQNEGQYLSLNKQKYDEITQAIAEETKAKALLEAQNIIESESYRDLLENLDNLSEVQLSQLSNMTAEAMGWLTIANNIDNATSAYNRFINASSATSDSRYTALSDAMKVIEDTLYNTNSDIFGKVGREQYKAAMAYIGINAQADPDQIKAEIENAKKYIGNGVEGINAFVNELMASNLTSNGVINEGVTVQDIAKYMGLSEDAVRALIAEYNTYFSENPIEIEASDSEYKSALDVLGETLDAIKEKQDAVSNGSISYDTGSAVESLQAVSNVLTDILKKLRELQGMGGVGKVGGVDAPTYGKPTTHGHQAALASGGFSRGGKTLVGELGREIVVDPNTGKWFTVGEHGAEFVTLPKNAFVINAGQTEKLLGNKSARRGDSYAFGTYSRTFQTGAGADPVYGVFTPISTADDVTPKPPKKPATETTTETTTETIEDQLQAITDQYSAILAQIDHRIKHWEHAYDVAEHGMDYSGMDKSLSKQIALYQKKYKKLEKELKKMRKAGAKDTDEEYQAVEEEMWKIYNTVNDLMSDLNDLYVDGLNEKIDSLQNAYSTLSDAVEEFNETGSISLDTLQALGDNGLQYLAYLRDENGQLSINEESIQKLLKAEKERLAVETALRYITEIQQALEAGEVDVVNSLINATNVISDNTWGAVWASLSLLKTLGLTNDQYQQVYDNVYAWYQLSQNTTTSLAETVDATEDELHTMDDLLKKVKELIKWETNQQINAIKEQISKYKEIINLKKEALKKDKEEADYQKEVSERVAEIAEIQAQIDRLALDNSRSTQIKRLELEKELAEKTAELDEYQADHAYDMKVESLDNMAQAYEDSRQDEIEALENSISSEEKLTQLAMERIRNGWNTIYNDLIAWNSEYGSVLNSEITEAWENAKKAVEDYGSVVAALQATVTGSTTTPTTTTATTTTPTTTTTTTTAPTTPTAEQLNNLNTMRNQVNTFKSQRSQYTRQIQSLEGKPNLTQKEESQLREYNRKLQDVNSKIKTLVESFNKYAQSLGLTETLKVYHSGGVVKGDKDEIFAVLKRGEMVLDDKAQEAVYKFINFPSYIATKFGASLDKLSNALGGGIVPSGKSGIADVSSSGASPVGGMVLNAEFNTTISHNGTMTGADAQRYGQQIGQSALAELQQTFMRKGISRLGTRLFAT